MKFTVLSVFVLSLSASVYSQSVQSGVCLATCGSNDYVCKAKCLGVPIPNTVSPAMQSCLRGCTSSDAGTVNCLKNCVSGNGANAQPSATGGNTNNNQNGQSTVAHNPTVATTTPTTQAHSHANVLNIGVGSGAALALTLWGVALN